MRKFYSILILVTGLLLCNSTIIAQPGTFDASFANEGIFTYDFFNEFDMCYSMALQPDGKIILAGKAREAHYDFAALRLNADGTLDQTFGDGGKVVIPVVNSSNHGLNVVLQPDGKIIINGYANAGSSVSGAMVRLNSDGSLDNSFGNNGTVVTIIPGSPSIAESIALQSDGKIVLAGYINYETFNLFRYNTDGTLDNTFGENGIVTTEFENVAANAIDLAIQSDDKIVCVGFITDGIQGDIAATRYNANGTLDTDFATDGKLIINETESFEFGLKVKILNDGKILLGGHSNLGIQGNLTYHCKVIKLNQDGSLDNSFGTNGIATTAIAEGGYSNNESYLYALNVQSDGKILAGGHGSLDGDYFAHVYRLDESGNLDTSFGGEGVLRFKVNQNETYIKNIQIQNDGKILAAGYSYNGDNFDFMAIRLLNDEELVCDPVENLVVEVLDNISGNIRISWDKPQNMDPVSYTILLSDGTTHTTTDTQIELTVGPACSFSVIVTAVYDNCTSAPVQATVDSDIDAPYNVDLQTTGNNIQITWESNMSIDLIPELSFNIYRNDNLIANIKDYSFTDEDLPVGTYCYTIATKCGDIISDMSEEVCKTLSIEDCNASEITIYPIPTKDVLNISSDVNIDVIEVFNMQGQVVYRSYNNGNKMTISVDKFTAGVYQYKITDTNGISFGKFVVN